MANNSFFFCHANNYFLLFTFLSYKLISIYLRPSKQLNNPLLRGSNGDRDGDVNRLEKKKLNGQDWTTLLCKL